MTSNSFTAPLLYFLLLVSACLLDALVDRLPPLEIELPPAPFAFTGFLEQEPGKKQNHLFFSFRMTTGMDQDFFCVFRDLVGLVFLRLRTTPQLSLKTAPPKLELSLMCSKANPFHPRSSGDAGVLHLLDGDVCKSILLDHRPKQLFSISAIPEISFIFVLNSFDGC